MIKWMAQTDPPRNASKIQKNEWPVATPLFKQNDTLILKKRQLPSGV